MAEPFMIIDKGESRLTVRAEDATYGVKQVGLQGRSAKYAVEALGRGSRLLILDGDTGDYREFELVDIRLREVRS